ncbi:hypothetical protein Tco_1112259 [Tanacetum coccineum]|uniref:Uncharacterized protein n=1 Tax=Tanacetum coccineum TaxID=301880 RepID=A0ABQ5IPE0_9ASTR
MTGQMHTPQTYKVPEGRTSFKGRRGPPGQVTIQPLFFFNKDLDYLLIGDKEQKIALSISKLKAARYLDFSLEELVPSLWVESEREYDISAVYGITHWVCPGVRKNRIYLREIILRRADYQEYKISEKDFKNLHPNDFEDLFLLNIQEKLNHLPKTDKTSLHTTVNIWIRNLFSDGNIDKSKWKNWTTWSRDFHLIVYNKEWRLGVSEDDNRISKNFITAIKKRLQIRRIFRSLESFVGGRIRDIDYRLINNKQLNDTSSLQ